MARMGGPHHSCLPRCLHPMEARGSSFYTGQILITPWLPQPQLRWTHPFSMSGQDKADQAQEGLVCELPTPQTRHSSLLGLWAGPWGVRRPSTGGFQGLYDGAGMGVEGVGQTQGGRSSHCTEDKK